MVLIALLTLSSEAQQAPSNDRGPDEPTLSLLDSPLPYFLPEAKCPDPHLRSAEIGGKEISASLVKDHKPVPWARAQLFSGQKLVWNGATGRDGIFTIRNLAPGLYKLQVEFWGTTMVRLNPKLSYIGPQTVSYHLVLMDNGCVDAGATTN